MLYRRGKTYHYDFFIGGRRYRGSTKQRTETKARIVESNLMTKIEQGQLPAHHRKMPILRDSIAEFKTQVSFMPKKDSRRYYENGCRLLLATYIAGMRIDQIDQFACERLVIPGSGSNANCALRTLRRILNVAWKKGYLSHQAEIKLREEDSREVVANPVEELLLMQEAKQPLRDVLMLIRDAGFRPKEAMALPWRNVDFFRNAVFLERGKVKKTQRWIPLSDRLRAALLERAKLTGTGEWVFPSKARSGKATASGHLEHINATFHRVRTRANLPAQIVPYTLRHTLATTLAEETGNMKLVQGLVGHSRINTTMRYVHPGMKEAVAAVNRVNAERTAAATEELLSRHNSRHNSHLVN